MKVKKISSSQKLCLFCAINWKSNLPKLIRGRCFLAVRILPLDQEPVRILLFIVDQFSPKNKYVYFHINWLKKYLTLRLVWQISSNYVTIYEFSRLKRRHLSESWILLTNLYPFKSRYLCGMKQKKKEELKFSTHWLMWRQPFTDDRRLSKQVIANDGEDESKLNGSVFKIWFWLRCRRANF